MTRYRCSCGEVHDTAERNPHGVRIPAPIDGRTNVFSATASDGRKTVTVLVGDQGEITVLSHGTPPAVYTSAERELLTCALLNLASYRDELAQFIEFSVGRGRAVTKGGG